VFRICDKGAFNTLSNQAICYKLGRVLDSPLFNAKCNMPIMKACKKDVTGPNVKGEKWNKFGKTGANSHKIKE